MLSTRGQANAEQKDIPWRFAQGTTFDAETNPGGLVGFSASENALMRGEIDEFVKKVRSSHTSIWKASMKQRDEFRFLHYYLTK